MKKFIIISIYFVTFFALGKLKPILPYPKYTSPALRFTENKGQWFPFIKTKTEIGGGEMYFSGNAFVYHFIDYNRLHDITHNHKAQNDSLSSTILKVAFVNANKNANPIYTNPYPDYQNYFIGNDSSKWHPKVYSYQNVKVQDFYPNIDLFLYSKGQDLKYDLVAKPHAEINKIAIKYSGQQSIRLKNNALRIETNQCRLTELQPVAYQNIGGQKKIIACNYVLENDIVTFKIGSDYDSNYSLTIDPQIVFSSYTGSKADNFGFTATYDQDGNTYVGGIVFNLAYLLEIYGYPQSIIDEEAIIFPVDSFPASQGAYQTRFQGGLSDVVIFKFSKDGTRRQYATYLGGTATETPHSMIVNSANQLVVFGATGSTNFPQTVDVYKSPYGAGSFFRTFTDNLLYPQGSQVYATIFNETGTALISSVVVGTNGNSGVNYTFNLPLTTNLVEPTENYYNYGDHFRGEVIVDKKDNVIVATYTYANRVPNETISKVMTATDALDAWVFKLSPDLKQLKFSKRIGGNGIDAAFGLQPDSKGNLFIAGHTGSTDLVGTISGLNKTLQGKLDGFVSKLDSFGNILACSYLGTAEDDQAFFVQTNLIDEVFVMGQTWSNAYPIVSKGTSPFYNVDPGSGQFIHKLDNNLTSTGFSTVFGSQTLGPDISPTAFLVDNCGLIYVSGWRGNLKYPSTTLSGRRLRITQTEFNPVNAAGFYFGVFEMNMKGLSYGTYFGNDNEDHVDGGTSRFDKRGYIHQAICGGCGSSTTPTTPNVWSNVNKSDNCNMVGVKYDFETVDIKAKFTSKPVLKNDTIRITAGQSIDFNFTGQTLSGSNVYWQVFRYPSNKNPLLVTTDPTWTARPTLPLPTYMSLRKWQIQVDYAKSEDCIQSDIQTFYIAIDPSITGANICNKDSGQFNILGNIKSAKWMPIKGLSNSDIKNPKVWVEKDTSYLVEVAANDNSLSGRYKVPVRVNKNSTKANFSFLSDSIGPFPLTIATKNQSLSKDNNYIWTMGDGSVFKTQNPTYTYSKIGKYTVKLKIVDDSTFCPYTDSLKKIVYVLPKINEVAYCPENPNASFTVSGGSLCIWSLAGKNLSGCLQTLKLIDTGAAQSKVLVYSEPNKEYSYVFTVTAKSKPYTPTKFEYNTNITTDWNDAQVEFIGLNKVKSQLWDVGLDKKYTDSVFSVQYSKTATYPIVISGVDSTGCLFRLESILEIELMRIPNVITPNGDGINETFEIKGLKSGSATVQIYNRWGVMVYESEVNGYENNWNASGLTDGLYYYNLKLNYRPGKFNTGWVQVIR